MNLFANQLNCVKSILYLYNGLEYWGSYASTLDNRVDNTTLQWYFCYLFNSIVRFHTIMLFSCLLKRKWSGLFWK